MIERTSIRAAWRDFIEQAALGAWRNAARWRPSRILRLVEAEPSRFLLDGAPVDIAESSSASAVLRGADVTVQLHSSRVWVRAIRLPGPARAFVDSIVAGQVDRLMPWPAGAFHHGCRIASDGPDGLDVLIAGVGAAEVTALCAAIMAHAPRRLTCVAPAAGQDIVIYDTEQTSPVRRALPRRMEIGLLASLAFSCVAAILIQVGANDLSQEQERLSARQAALRDALVNRSAAPDVMARVRKAEDRSVTLALDQLAALVPDDTFLTALEISGVRLTASGQSRDANALIGLLEKSGRFADVRFLAPTVRDAAGVERFQIEARAVALKSSE